MKYYITSKPPYILWVGESKKFLGYRFPRIITYDGDVHFWFSYKHAKNFYIDFLK